MALSPGVYSREKDLTFNIQSITSNAAGYVGLFPWGPVNEVVDITSNESELVRRFGQPDNATAPYFHAAANYMLYSVPLAVVRVAGENATNAFPFGEEGPGPQINNIDQYENQVVNFPFFGRYPGSLANGLVISCADAFGFADWEYASSFEFAPQGSEFNMVVVDSTGTLTGTAGTIVERYSNLRKEVGAKKTDGTSANVVEVIKRQSNYILVGDPNLIDFTVEGTNGVVTVVLANGVDDHDESALQTGWSLFASKEDVAVTRLITSFHSAASIGAATDIAESRGDCIVFAAPSLETVYNNPNRVADLVEYFGNDVNKNSSYIFQVDNWKSVYDKYRDSYMWIPCDSDAAGLHARVMTNNEPWESPAGFNRGHLKNVVKLAWNSNQADRDVLYPANINSICAFKGEGTVLYGDKTGLRAPSAFSRINVRTLFIVMKTAIAQAARYQLFEINDFITQAIFRGACERYLENIKGRRGVTDYRVVCDSSNNTPQVIDNNEFIGDIYVKPSRTISTIHLTFVAVATGVEFAEIEGA